MNGNGNINVSAIDGLDPKKVDDLMDTSDIESNIAGPIMDKKKALNGVNEQFTAISDNINKAMASIAAIYHQIGYSPSEISVKKSEIFSVISDTITNFTSKIEREKSSVENECEWLRQQIQLILAMIDDSKGSHHISTQDQSLVFKQSKQGYQTDFDTVSPFLENTTSSVSNFSLLQLKSRLNCIFLDVLTAFVQPFKNLINIANVYWDHRKVVGEIIMDNSMVKYLPEVEEIKKSKVLVQKFELAIQELKPRPNDSNNEHYTFIISSPRKSRRSSKSSGVQFEDSVHNAKETYNSSSLPEINHSLILIIRSLKFTKINSELLSQLKSEVKQYEQEVESRSLKMVHTIDNCLDNIALLCLNNDQIIEIQKQSDFSFTESNEGYFDIDTLHFIRHEPKNFGLKDDHLEYLERFFTALDCKREAKQKKYDFYIESCNELWAKFNEDVAYIDQFLQANNSLSDISLLNFEMELNKLTLKRSKFIEKFISDSRAEIEYYWDKLHVSEATRKEFKYYDRNSDNSFVDSSMNGKVLEEHEKEVSRLKAEYAEKESILTLYEQLLELLKDKQFLQESSKDSSRLLSKNSCKILLNEEKIRKKLHKQLPKVFETLKKEIKKYDETRTFSEDGQPTSFEVNGENLYQKVLALEEEQARTQPSRRTKPSISPSKARNPRTSPTRIHSVPSGSESQTQAKRTTSFPGLGTHKSPEVLSFASDPFVRKRPILQRKNDNSAATRLSNALTGSISSNSSHSSLDSPIRFHRKVRNSNPLKTLQPLHVPLRSQGQYDKENTGTFQSKIPRVSPVKYRGLPLCSISPPKRNQLNSSPKHTEISDFSPVKLSGDMFDDTTRSRRLSITTCDSSTVIGDDYQTWRDEKIKSFNT